MQELNHFPAPVPSEATAPRVPRGAAWWQRLWHEEEGQTLVEYGLLMGLLALVVIVAVTFFGRRMSNNLYGTSSNVLPFNY